MNNVSLFSAWPALEAITSQNTPVAKTALVKATANAFLRVFESNVLGRPPSYPSALAFECDAPQDHFMVPAVESDARPAPQAVAEEFVHQIASSPHSSADLMDRFKREWEVKNPGKVCPPMDMFKEDLPLLQNLLLRWQGVLHNSL